MITPPPPIMNGMFIIGTNANEKTKRNAFERLKTNVMNEIDNLYDVLVRCMGNAMDEVTEDIRAVIRKNMNDPETVVELYKQRVDTALKQMFQVRLQRMKEADDYFERMRSHIDETKANNKNKTDCTELMLVSDRVKEYVETTIEEMRLPSYFFGELTNTRDLIYYPPKRRN